MAVILVKFTGVISDEIYETNNLLTYSGVLIGFGLTLYTFGLSILKDIYEVIDKISFKKIENKELIIKELKAAFKEIRNDIVVMFFAIIAIFISTIISNTINPFEWDVEYLKIPEILKMSVFLYTTFALADIMKSLFDLSKLIFKN
ncbi:hypothetical protein SAMN05421846_101338 [Chryseobacterium taeanense]|uniref:Uncharacterized protein n=1 Tax=Chryseobacterium taeanense TaxID=311334 RepID=A0A1G8DWJ6_9FLAO|nr:hypothetical protein SAMN05421846_101338 [Chryseobacterium taeanense]